MDGKVCFISLRAVLALAPHKESPNPLLLRGVE